VTDAWLESLGRFMLLVFIKKVDCVLCEVRPESKETVDLNIRV
jgi:hypothetical protein